MRAMRVLVVGGVAGGASTAARLRRLDESAEIVIFERGPHVSFSNCSLPYYLGGVVEDSDDLLMMTPEGFKRRFNIDVRVGAEVVSIDPAAKSITVKDAASGATHVETYDNLVLAPGADPIMPKSIKGIDRPNVFAVRNVPDVVAIKHYAETHGVKNVAVAGGGFIGIEVAENLTRAGYKVSVIEGMGQILAPFDDDMVQLLHKELLDNGVDLHLSAMVTEIADGVVRAQKDGREIEVSADMVIMSIGVAPSTKLAEAAGLEIGETRGIKVDTCGRTSDPDIYAVGDVTEKYDALARRPGKLALAGPAQWEARAAADHIHGLETSVRGYIGSSCLQVFELNAASTGMNVRSAKRAGIPCDHVYVLPNDKVGIMPDSNYMAFKLVFEVPTGRILGAQAIGRGNVTKRVDVIAAMITMGADLRDLKSLELCYSPIYSTAKDVVNMAALAALNVLSGRVKQAHVDEVRGLVESGAYIIDVREADEYAEGHVRGAVNIPLSELRGRLSEVPKDRPVYLYCRSSHRSYYALCDLLGHGFTNAVNISGSFLGISLHEYFRDTTEGREPIVTAYNFE